MLGQSSKREQGGWWSADVQSRMSAAGVSSCSGEAGKVEDGAHDASGVTRADLHGIFGPQVGSGSGLGGGTEARCGFGSEVQSPAAAPLGPGCAEAGAGLGPC